MNDRRLIEQLKAQRRDALDRAIERYTPYVSVIVYHAMEGALREDIEEVTADVFIALWRTAASITGENLAGYLAAIARNQAKSWLRARRPPEEDLEDVVLPGPDTAAGPVFQREQRSLLAEALRQLGEPDEAIFRLHYQQGCSAQQIARQLGMPGATVRTRLFRGRRKLKQYFEERGLGYEELL